ncbi:MAG: leucine-rich repeat protein [Ruminococcus sp.]
MKKEQNKSLKWVHTRSTRRIAFLLVVTMIMSIVGIATYSAETTDTTEETVITSGDYQYSLLEDGTAQIDKYTGTETDLTIPTDLDGNKITQIGGYSFENCKSIVSLTIPKGITTIGENAFRFCENIETVSLPDGLTTINNGAFSYCESLNNVVVPNSITTLGNYAFQGCKALTYIKLPNSIDVLCDSLFTSCESLTSIDIPSNIKEIGQNTFAHCYGLTSVTVPEGVTLIDTGAFSYCENMTSISLPNTLEAIGAFAFSNCIKLMEITVPDSVTDISRLALGYWFDLSVWNDIPLVGFVLKGYTGSAADRYAQEYNVTFESIGISQQPQPTTTQPPSTVPPEPGTVYTVYFKNTSNFSNVYAYYWPDGGSGPVAWPGTAMTNVSDDVYSIQVPAENNMIIFSNKGSSQTGNLAIPGDNYIYDGEWKVYSDVPTETSTTQTEPTTSSTTQTEPTTSSSTEPTTSSQPSYTKGDVNGDGDVDIADATILQKYINMVAVTIQQEVADVNGDGRIDVRDVTMIQKKVAGYNVF